MDTVINELSNLINNSIEMELLVKTMTLKIPKGLI
jgi:hypothetical protein